MKDIRRFFRRKVIILFFLILISSIWKIAEPWKIYLWILLIAFLPMAIFPVLGKPLYSLWRLYVRHTSEGMRFFQGVGILLCLLAFYILKYHHLTEAGISLQVFLERLFSEKNVSTFPAGKYRYLGLAGILLFLAGSIPFLANFLFSLWMGFAGILQAISSRVILFLVYLFAMLPVGLLAKLVGKQFLDKSFRDDVRESYWIDREDRFDPRHYRRSF